MPNFLPAKRGFKMACLNINSLVKHVDELRVLLAEFSIDILAINETKLDESINSSELHISGYEFIRRDRNRNGGGVGFYIKSSNSYVVRSDLTIEIRKPNSKPFLVATWYRPPSSSTDLFSSYESFIVKLDSLDLEYDHSLIYVYRKLSSNLPSKGHSSISYRNFRNEVSQQDWFFDEFEDPNLGWSNWKTKFLRVV